MSNDQANLDELWRLRNAAAVTLGLTEDQMRRAVRGASVDELIALVETFAPGRAPGPEWTRTFEPLVERLWSWRDDATMAALAETFQARGMPWAAVANALSVENGARIKAGLRHPAWARQAAFTQV
ncbi:MAG: hypothetical protein JSS43_24185 [Proteobacteria bacterium]|nr:hypothetical protein [Pseudomonadota bacterium]